MRAIVATKAIARILLVATENPRLGVSDRVAADVEFAAGLFALEAIKHAAYRFSDKLVIEIEPDDTRVLCRLRLIGEKKRGESLEFLVAQFRNEVLDQDLRIQLRHETAPVRNLILSLAFSKTGLQG